MINEMQIDEIIEALKNSPETGQLYWTNDRIVEALEAMVKEVADREQELSAELEELEEERDLLREVARELRAELKNKTPIR